VQPAESTTLLSIIQAAGWPIWPLIACSVLALSIIIERFVNLRAARVAPPDLLNSIITRARAKALTNEEIAAWETGSLLGMVLSSPLRRQAYDLTLSSASVAAALRGAEVSDRIDALVRAGLYRCVLLVGAEVHSSGLDVSTRGRDVAVLFGDGAGAAVITPTDDVDTGILDVLLHADGTGAELLMLEAPASRSNPRLTPSMLEEGRHYPRMDGPAVFRRAVERLPEVAREILARNGLTVADVDLVVPHQANLRINLHVAQELGMPPEKVVHTVQRWGNTTAASIPTALDLAREDGRARPGSLVLMLAFGAGLTWGAALVRL
jgi:3-oxoacyl-(acyl-carrier-protein) synthase III